MSANDSINRAGSANERLLTDYIKANNSTCEIMDSYRSVESSAGYTWTRQACQSRLDYIFVSQYLTSRITRVEVSYSFEQSDHAAVMVEMHVNEDIKVGPGLTKVNSAVLSDPAQLLAVKAEISEMMGQIPVEWDPHQRLEFFKVAIRTTVSEAVGRDRGELRKSIAEIEESLDDMHKLKCKACAVVNVVERDNKVGLITNAIDRLANDLALLREKQSAATSFKSRARWFDQGEKSNKYFLNLNKKYSKKKIIDRIKCNDVTHVGQDDVTTGISGFYQRLYSSGATVQDDDDEFYSNCPTLSGESRALMDADITEDELRGALSTCADSAPGSDGIPYGVYKKLWTIAGPVILDAWNYSCVIGEQPVSNKESIIVKFFFWGF